MPYPTALLATAILIVLGLGAYQRLNVEVERQVDRKDNAEQFTAKLDAAADNCLWRARRRRRLRLSSFQGIARLRTGPKVLVHCDDTRALRITAEGETSFGLTIGIG